MIDQFIGQYRFLSNFYPCNVTYNDIDFLCVESAYQASKTSNRIIQMGMKGFTGNLAKKYAKINHFQRSLNCINIMESLLIQKFSDKNIGIKNLLIETGNEELIEGNYWNDTFWGVNLKTGYGQNNLGKLLMKIRSRLTNG
jgi:ribA/ribD-fused uncharacterized protein